MNNEEVQARLDRLDNLHRGFCEEAKIHMLDNNPDAVIYALAMEQAAWQLAAAMAALERLRMRSGLRITT